MRVSLTNSMRETVLENLLKPLVERKAELMRALEARADDFVDEYIGPSCAEARRKLMHEPGVLSISGYITFKVEGYGTPLIIRLNGNVYGAPEILRPYYYDKLSQDQKNKLATITGPTVDKLRPVWQEIRDNIDRRKLLTEELTRVFNESSTLQEVTKAWPTVLDYVPKEVVERFHRKIERTKPAEKPELVLAGEAVVELTKLRLGAV